MVGEIGELKYVSKQLERVVSMLEILEDGYFASQEPNKDLLKSNHKKYRDLVYFIKIGALVSLHELDNTIIRLNNTVEENKAEKKQNLVLLEVKES